jgi:hypothetical protein
LKVLLYFVTCCALTSVYAEQVADANFLPQNTHISFSAESRPLVLFDEAHHNAHTLDGTYQGFAKVLESDGYSLAKNSQPFSAKGLQGADILVIVNALDERNLDNEDLPNYSAFSREEVEAIYYWVNSGGSLFLIADHMPWPKAAEPLASIFGFHFSNGYTEVLNNPVQMFMRGDNSLNEHVITNGINQSENIEVVRGFMGQAMLIPPNAQPLLTFRKESISHLPAKSWGISDDTPRISATGWQQGASLEFGKGRVIVFGEAGMFTAQIASDETEQWKMGMNAEGAERNEQFLLNIMHWLSKLL